MRVRRGARRSESSLPATRTVVALVASPVWLALLLIGCASGKVGVVRGTREQVESGEAARPSTSHRSMDVRPASHEVQRANYEIIEPPSGNEPFNIAPVDVTPASFASADVAPVADAFSIPEVIDVVTRRHPALRVRRFEVEAARARWVTAGLLPNPQLVVEEEIETNGSGRHETVAWTMFTLPVGPQRRLRQLAASADIEARQARLSRESRQIVTTAVEKAVEVQYWQELVEIDGRQRDMAAELATVQAARFEANEADFRERFVADLGLADAETRLRATMANLAVARVELNEAMGMAPGRHPTIREPLRTTRLPPLQLADVVARARRVLPEIEEGWRGIEASQQRWSAERWRAAPDVSIGPRYRDSPSGASDRAGGRLAMDLPVFNRNQGGVLEAAADVDANWARLQSLELRATSDVAATFVALQAIDANLAYVEQHALPLVESGATTLHDGFTNRLVAAQPLLETLSQLGRVRREHAELRRRHLSLQARLELLLETRLSDLAQEAGPIRLLRIEQ